ncbi:MAG: alpha/beta hydrolase [Burkholderiales bacterium]|nr:alpha/beta hydrolase [Nitrosomonas sp.]MCP5243987.1 alpha/beta hydrolase [Burkholderiales bacterium]
MILQNFFIEGSAGKIETVLAEPRELPKGIAVIAHPHPLHGGTMDNKVVYTLFNSMLELGFIAVKFNFRGVGKSEGMFDNGIGETEDIVTVTQTIQHQFDHHLHDKPLLLAGFSFGGGVQLRAVERLNPQSLVLVAPSIQTADTTASCEGVEQVLIIQGDQDEIIPLTTILDWATPHTLPIVVIPGAEHFFHGKLTILKRTIHRFMKI